MQGVLHSVRCTTLRVRGGATGGGIWVSAYACGARATVVVCS